MPTEIILSRTAGETWIAVKQDGRIAELIVDRERQRSLVGNIYRGRVTRVMPGMQAAFVDIGLDRDAFLYAGDMPGALSRPPDDVDEGEDGEDRSGGASWPRAPDADIRKLVRQGQELVVQVSKDPFGTKGARVTGIVSVAGRSLVLLPAVDHVGVSRRISSSPVRERLRELVEPFRPEGGGLIVRTAAAEETEEAFRREARALREEWDGITERAAAARAPALVRRELDVPLKVLRDHAGPDLRRVVADDAELVAACRELASRIAPEITDRIALHAEPLPLTDHEGLGSAVEAALKARVWLRSGGYLVINPTEALVAIDVNSGRYLGQKDLEDTALRINLEAAVEVARQVRLRDLAGIIVVDFIDMAREDSRRRLMTAVQEALAADRSRTNILGLSEFCMLTLTRKRTRRSLERSLCSPCPYCSGRGRVRSAATVAGQVARALRRQGRGGRPLRVRVHPDVAAELGAPEAGWLDGARHVEVVADATLHREAFELTEAAEPGL